VFMLMFISQHGTQIPGKEPLRLLFPLESREGFTAFYRWTRLPLAFFRILITIDSLETVGRIIRPFINKHYAMFTETEFDATSIELDEETTDDEDEDEGEENE